jgi:branched-chain amino acid transport system substrate-binding protein
MKKTRRSILKAAAALSALGFPSIVRSQSAPLKAGVILPLSGVLASSGVQTRRGTELAIKMFGEQGVRIDAFFLDTESKPENGRVAAEKAIRDGANVLIGAWDSGATIAAAQVAEAAKIPLVINIGSSPQITEQGFTQVFRNFPNAIQLVTNAVNRVKSLPRSQGFNPKTAVLMHVNDTFGTAMFNSVKALWDKLDVGIKIIETISYDARARDLSVEVAKAKAAGADIVAPITRTNDAILLVREMVKQDFNPQAIIAPGSPGVYEKAFSDALGKYADDSLVCIAWYDPTRPLTKRVLERWSKDYPNERMEVNPGFGWESIQVVADAYQRAQSTRPADLHAALKTTNIADHIMFGGPIAFDAKGHNNNIGGVLLQNQNQQPVVVMPKEAAMSAAVLPMRPWNKR